MLVDRATGRPRKTWQQTMKERNGEMDKKEIFNSFTFE